MRPTIHARRYDTGQSVIIELAGDRIADIRPGDDLNTSNLPIVAPAFFDLQINGFGGHWFGDADLTPEEVAQVLRAHFRYGITRLCPTLITNSRSAIIRGLSLLRSCCESEAWIDRIMPGIHIEGPFLSAEDGPRGAHPREHIRACDLEEFHEWQEAADGRIRLVTLAPEADGAARFTAALVRQGVRVAIGHTAATSDQIAAVVDAGAVLSTHLGNGAAGMIRRHPNFLWDQLAEDRLTASLIADGHHLPPAVLKTFVRAKSPERIILTCDASGLAGLPPGEYPYGDAVFEVLADGPIVIAGQRQYLAGSGQHLDTCVATIMTHAEVSLSQACDMASRRPASLLGFDVATLSPGSPAELILFDYHGPGTRLKIREAWTGGERVWTNAG